MTGRGADRDPRPPHPDMLTDPQALRAGDRYGLLPALATAGAQVRSVAEQVAGADYQRPRSLIVLEPAPTGDGALAAAVLGHPRVPVLTSETLPAWAGPLDLAVVLAPSPDDRPTAELVAEAVRRGVTVVVRGADHGPVAAAADAALIAPRIAVPEIAAGPGRVALVLAVAFAADVAPPTSPGGTSADPALAAMADALDAEALACGPSAEPFVNPAVTLALGLLGSPALLIADEPAGMALARRCARSLRLLGGHPAAAEHAAALMPGGQLTAALARPADPFADPDVDGPAPAGMVPVLLESPDGTPGRRMGALERALARAVLLAADEAGGAATRALAVALRADFAAAYLGIAAGQVPPPDGPHGLGPLAGVRDVRPTATVDDVPTKDAGENPWS